SSRRSLDFEAEYGRSNRCPSVLRVQGRAYQTTPYLRRHYCSKRQLTLGPALCGFLEQRIPDLACSAEIMIHPIQDQGAHRGQLHVLTIKEFDVEVPLVSVRTIERQQVIANLLNSDRRS